jgi:hypothetical protein
MPAPKDPIKRAEWLKKLSFAHEIKKDSLLLLNY